MKRLLVMFSLLFSSCLIAGEINSETYTYENFEYDVAFDLTKDWVKDAEEKDDFELTVNFLSPTKKQLTVSICVLDCSKNLQEFFAETIAQQEQDGDSLLVMGEHNQGREGNRRRRSGRCERV